MALPRRARAVGVDGEDLAARWYAAHGYEVVARNFRVPAGELDVVARRGSLVVFCEVKARSSAQFGSPALAVSPAKQQRLRRAAAAWLAGGRGRGAAELRFDVATVVGDDIDVIEGAF